jgi:hypothetical protein
MMFRELNSFARVHRFAFADPAPRIGEGRRSAMPRQAEGRLPRRPDASVINEAIPLFYIGRNRKGLWVAREAEGRIGGIFLTRRAAIRFAKETCEPMGCATMFVTQPLELGFTRSDTTAGPREGTANANERSVVLTVMKAAATAAGRIFTKASRALASERRNRRLIEKDLFGGRYVLCSKNDDDFPIS